MKKKLVFFIGGLNFGGMERVVFIATELLKKEYDITIATLYQTEADYDVVAKLYDLNVPPKGGIINKIIVFIKRLIRTRKMKKELNPDIVYSFGMYSNYLNALTKSKEKIVMGIRSYDWLTKPFTTSFIDKCIISKFDSINSVSKLIAKDAEKIWGIPAEENRVIYNPYDIEYIQNKALENIEDYKFDKNKFYYVSMGRLSVQKGYEHLIRAFSIVEKEIGNVHLIIMGNGEKRKELECMVNKLGLSDKVDLLEGKKNPYKYVKQAQAYVMSSYTEGFPNALVEAMCIGTPVVSVNCKSGPAEILYKTFKDSFEENFEFEVADFGILTREMIFSDEEKINHQNENALAKGMIYAYLNRELMKELSVKAVGRASEFTYDRFKKTLYEEVEAI